MTWSGKSVSVTKNPDGKTFALVFEATDGSKTEQVTAAFVSEVDSIAQIIENDVTQRNRDQAQKDAIAALDPQDYANVSLEDLKARKAPPPPTQDELDFQAWQMLKADWQKKSKILQSGLSTTVKQADVDAAYAAMKAAYKESYGDFL